MPARTLLAVTLAVLALGLTFASLAPQPAGDTSLALSSLPVEGNRNVTINLGKAIFPDPERSLTRDNIATAYARLGRTIPREVQVGDLAKVSSEEGGEFILSWARLVYLHFPFATQAVRAPAPKEYAKIFQSLEPGYCDAAAHLYGQLIRLPAYNINIIAPKKEADIRGVDGDVWSYWAHTASEIEADHGAILIDPTFGFVLVTKAKRFTLDVFQSGRFEIYTLFDTTELTSAQLRDLEAGLIYLKAATPTSSVARSGERINPVLPSFFIPKRSRISIGKADESSEEFSAQFGGWGNHLGLYYEPTITTWQFSPEEPGTYRIEVKLLGGKEEVFSTPLLLDAAVSNGILLSPSREITFRPDRGKLALYVAANEHFSLHLSSQSSSARLIDSINVEPVSPRGACGMNIFCQIRAKNFIKKN